jgi:hypothetical protein
MTERLQESQNRSNEPHEYYAPGTIPPCARWNIWIGREIEGTIDIGVWTLFVRFMPRGFSLENLLQSHPDIKRVWFCKEFRQWEIVREATKLFKTVCLEVSPSSAPPPKEVTDVVTCYFKFDYCLPKPGDFICVGKPFQDEAFRVGTGAKVSPSCYLDDTYIA